MNNGFNALVVDDWKDYQKKIGRQYGMEGSVLHSINQQNFV